MKHPNKEIMMQVLKYSKKYHTYSAFVVKDDKIISKSINTTKKSGLVTMHAEINAIEKASKKLNSLYLKDCWLYCSIEPCSMCSSASCWSRLEGVVYCLDRKDDLAIKSKNHNYINVSIEYIFKKAKIKPKLIKHFLRNKSKAI